MPARISHRSTEEYSQSDPFDRVWAPPANESLSDKEARMFHEAEAKKISDAIDQDIDRQRMAEKKAGKPVKVLLLGELPYTSLQRSWLIVR
jgi:guanine nucleotide-binding protein alpha-1 subunit